MAATALLMLAGAAAADPVFSATLSGVASVTNSATPVALTTNFDSNGGHVEGKIVADSTIAGRIETSDPPRGFGNGLFTPGTASASASFDDIVILGPGSAPISVTLHVPFHAGFVQDWSYEDFTNGVHDASRVSQSSVFTGTLLSSAGGVQAQFFLNNFDDFNQTANVQLNSINGGSVVNAQTAGNPIDSDGFLDLITRIEIPITTGPGVDPAGAGFEVFDNITLRGELLLPVTVIPGQQLTLQLAMSIANTAFGGFGLGTSGEVNALDTFGPAHGVPVFDLPDGYTAESASLHLVDNVIPEPGELLLVGLALIALVAL